MALDPGARRIGIAVSDSLGMIAQPLETLETGEGGEFPLAALRRLVTDRGVAALVVGLPCRLDGTHGPEAQAAATLAAELRRALGLPVELWDERLTTVEAERLLIAAGVRRKQRKGKTDRVAAALILQGFLDHRAAQQAPAAVGSS